MSASSSSSSTTTEQSMNNTSSNSNGSNEQLSSSPSSNKTSHHSLEHQWTLWFHNPAKKTNAANYQNFLNKVYDFDTIEQFWGLFNHIMVPSKLGVGCTYYLFRDQIRPEWESKECSEGGEWMLTLTTKQREELDQYWLNAVLACIGEAFDDDVCDAVCGCCVAIRKAQLRIALWIGTCEESVTIRLGQQFRDAVLLLNEVDDEQKKQFDNIQVVFKSFKDQLNGVRDPSFVVPQN